MARVRSQPAAIFCTNGGAAAPNPHHSHSGWLSGKMPLPSKVVATGASRRSARATKSGAGAGGSQAKIQKRTARGGE
jgi:hypothetical protein